MSHFFAYLEKMRFIKRWGLMRNTCEENIQEHSYQVATIAHALAMIRRKVFDRPVDIEKVLVCALYHDVSEVITGDLATPIKTFNPRISEVFGELGEMANRRLIGMVPENPFCCQIPTIRIRGSWSGQQTGSAPTSSALPRSKWETASSPRPSRRSERKSKISIYPRPTTSWRSSSPAFH